MAEAVIDEVKTTLELNSLDDDFLKEIVDIPKEMFDELKVL